MSNELVKLDFTEDQKKLIKDQIAPKATDNELKLFIYQAQRTGLDPLARQIYAIHRKSKDANGNWTERMTIQTSIDGFRVIAERSGDYAGQDEPKFVEDGDEFYCKVTVYRFRGEIRYPAAVGVAYWKEYVQTDKEGKAFGLWAKMPHTMLSKVAEALALRKAYPQDLSGLYTGDEMQQTDTPSPESVIDGPAHQLDNPVITIKEPKADKKEKPVTSYNHKPIEKNGLPIITNGQFKAAMQRIAAGEIDVYYKVKAEFSLEEKQEHLLKETLTEAKNQKV